MDDPSLVFGINEIGVRPVNSEGVCGQQRINRFNFELIVDRKYHSNMHSNSVVMYILVFYKSIPDNAFGSLCVSLFLSVAVSVSFVQPEYIVEEFAGLQSVCVRLDSGVVERRVIVSLSTADDDAVGKLNTILHSSGV